MPLTGGPARRRTWRRVIAGAARLRRTWPGWVRLTVAVVAAGVAVGISGTLLTLLLHAVQHVAFGYSEGSFLDGTEQSGRLVRVLAPGVGGLLCGLGWMVLRRRPIPKVEDGAAPRPRRLPAGLLSLDAVLQVVAVGTGSSIGREGAPRQVGGALSSVVSTLTGLPVELRRRLVVAGTGAGLAVVYNVPLSGVVFAAEVLAGGFGWFALLISSAVCGIAVAVSWPVLGTAATYAYPDASVDLPIWWWAVLGAPLAAVLGRLFDLMLRRAGRLRPRPGWQLPLWAGLGGLVVGALAVWWPSLLGNGKGIVQLALGGSTALVGFAALILLKPLATSVSYGTGITGGFLTPALGTGAALGAAVALAGAAAGQRWPVAGFALVGAVGVLSARQGTPWFAAVFGWELAHPPVLMALPLLVAAWGAVLVVRLLPGRQPGRSPGWG